MRSRWPEPLAVGASAHRRRQLVFGVAFVASAALLGCGGSSADRIVARVGATTITMHGLDAEMTAIASERFVPDPPHFTMCIARARALAPGSLDAGLAEECREQYETLKQHALRLLIAEEWAVGEAARLGLARASELPMHVADAPAIRGLEKGARSAEHTLREIAARTVSPVTVRDAVDYYDAHIRAYERPERRYFAIDERFTSRTAALVALRTGRFNEIEKAGYHESLVRTELAHPKPQRRAITRAVFAARIGVLSGPVPLYGTQSVFEVTKITPTERTPFPRVRASIAARLDGERRARALADYIERWRARWLAITRCASDYVVEACGNFNGRRVAAVSQTEFF